MATHQVKQSPLKRNALALQWVRRLSAAGEVVLLLVLLGGLYGTILQDLVWQWWNDDNYSHGFLVPLFSAFLVWQRRSALRGLTPRGTWLGLPVLLAGVAVLILGDIGAENFLMRSSLIVILTALVLLRLGSEIARVLAFPLVFLCFMVPLPAIVFYAVTFPLQNVAARNAAWALDWLGMPVLLDGNVLHLSQISLGVVEACSGIRSLISILALVVAWAYMILPGVGAMLAFVALAVPLTIVANIGRVVLTGLISQWFGVQYAQGFFHLFSGWLIFVFAFVCLLGIHALLRFTRVTRPLLPGGRQAAPTRRSKAGLAGRRMPAPHMAVACALLLGALLFLQFRSHREAVPIRQALDTFPIALGDWQGREATIFEVEILNVLKVKDYLMRRYVDPEGRSLWLYIGYWDTQRKGAQPHSPKNCLPGTGWEPLEAARMAVPIEGRPQPIEINRFLIQKDSAQQLVLYWYQSQGQVVASEVDAKVQLVRNAILYNRSDGAIIRISTPVYGSVQETAALQVKFAQAMFPHLRDFLPE